MHTPITLVVNDTVHSVTVDPARTLLSVLRDELGLTGAKYGCGDGKCGACTVHVDGKPVQACSITVGAAAGNRITTIEGLAQHGRLHALQAAFLDVGALQCGYCTPGMIMAAVALLAENPSPTDGAIIHALQDNLCRCGAHPRILAAVRTAARWLVEGNIPDIALAPEVVSAPWEAVETFEEGLLVAYPDPDVTAAEFGDDAPAPDQRPLTQIGPLVHIAEDGAVRVYVGKAEVGQNMRAQVAQLVAEELRDRARTGHRGCRRHGPRALRCRHLRQPLDACHRPAGPARGRGDA
ncbi:MAG: 2Fe-2S iron-sulfur cluster-binding protein [Tetrasphaera sp.]